MPAPALRLHASALDRLLLPLVALALCALAALSVVKPLYGAAGLGLAGAAAVFACALVWTLQGKAEPLVLAWFFLFPLGYYFFSIPREKSIITFDRAVVGALLLVMAFAPRRTASETPEGFRRTAWIWGAFLFIAGVSLFRGEGLLTVARLYVDSFCLPAILAWCVIRHFRVRRSAEALHTAAAAMSGYVALIGLAEFVTKEDLLPLPGSTIYLAGTLPRPNGPFYSNDAFALVGYVAFFLILFLRRTMGDRVTAWRRWVHAIGSGAALLVAVLPLFRSMLFSLLACLLLETIRTKNPRRRVAGVVVLVVVAFGAVGAKVIAPDAFEDRSRPDNFYQRLAQHRQTLQVIGDNPIFGVGIGRFKDVVEGDSAYMALYDGVGAANSPHNNIGAILAETGVVGLIPYVASQVLLFGAFRRLRARGTPEGDLAWRYFLNLFLGYWINGMFLACGYSADVNLCYMVALAVFYKYAITAPAAAPALARSAMRWKPVVREVALASR